MGDSQYWEALEGRDGPPSYEELFKAARRPEYRKTALKLLEFLELEPARDVHVRRKLAAARRAYDLDRQGRTAVKKFRHLEGIILKAETALTSVLAVCAPPPPPELVVARDVLRSRRPELPRFPKGRPELPFLPTARRDLGLDENDARILLRACGIPLSPGRPSRP